MSFSDFLNINIFILNFNQSLLSLTIEKPNESLEVLRREYINISTGMLRVQICKERDG